MAILLPTQPGLFAGAGALATGFESGAFVSSASMPSLGLFEAGLASSGMAGTPLSAMIGAYREALSLGNSSGAGALARSIAEEIRADRDALNRVLAQIPQGLMGSARFQSPAQIPAPFPPPNRYDAAGLFAETDIPGAARPSPSSGISAHRAGMRILNPSLNPEIGKFQDGVQSLLDSLLIPEDTEGGRQSIKIALIDDMQINVFIQKISDTEKVIGITLGMLKFVENDDELAFVLAHELSHGCSDIETHAIPGARREPSVLNHIFAQGLQRAVENEADVKAAILRLHQKGHNPHAARRWLDRLRNALGEMADHSHTMTSSRKDAIDMALAYLHRAAGETVKEDAPSQYSYALTWPLKDGFLNPPSFRQMQLARLREATNFSENPATQVFESARMGKVASETHESPYNFIYSKYLDEVIRLASGLVTVEEDIDLQLALHKKIDQLFEDARKKEFGDDFFPISPEQLRALLRADERNYNVQPWDIVSIRSGISKLRREELAILQLPANLENESRMRAIRRDLEHAEREYAQIRHAYVVDSGFDALVEDTAIESENLHGGGDRRRYDELKSRLDAHRRLFPLLEERNKARQGQIIEASAEVIIRDIGNPVAFKGREGGMEERLRMFFRLPEDVVRANIQRAFRAYMDAAMAYVDENTPRTDVFSKIKNVLGRYADHNDVPDQQLLIAYMKSLPDATARDFRELHNFMISRAPDCKTLEYIYGGAKRLPFATHIEGYPRVAFSPAFAMAVLDEETLSNYFGRYSALVTERARHLSLAEAIEATIKYTQRVKSSIENGLGAQCPAAIFKDACEQLADIASEKLRAALLEDNGIVLPPDAARNVLLAIQPGLLEIARRSGSLTLDDFERDVRLFGEIVTREGKTLNLIPFFALAEVVAQHAGTKAARLFSSLRPASSLPGHRSEEDFFRFMTDVSVLVHHSGSSGAGRDFTPAIALKYAGWLKRHHPDRTDLMASVLHPYNDPGASDKKLRSLFWRTGEKFFRERFDSYVERHSLLSMEERIEEAACDFWKEMKPWGLVWPTRLTHANCIRDAMSDEPQARVDFFNGYMRGVRRVEAEEGPQEIEIVGGEKVNAHKSKYDTKWFTNFFTTEDRLARANPDSLSKALLFALREEEPDFRKDIIFEHIWRRSGDREDIRKMFLDEELVGRLYYDENKANLAVWQLNARHAIDSRAAGIREGRILTPREGHIRAEVREAFQTINRQLPKKSAAKNDIIAYIEDSLLTNDTETRYLSQQRLGLNNWYESRLLAALDAPTAANRAIESNYHRLELIRYLIDATHEAPRFVREYSQKHGVLERDGKKLIEALPVAKRFFMEADVHTRNYVLQPLLDEKYGILEEEGVYREMVHLILGEHSGNDVVEAIFRSYLESVPPFERKVILGHILASFADNSGHGASIATVLESMGPFGVKAAQFLRTSGLVGRELATDLDHFLDRAMPPIRPEIFAELKKVFGDRLAYIHHVMELAGSGSISYAVVADMQNPVTRKITRVVIRVLRETTEGRAGNENNIWQLAISKIMSSGNPRHRRIARILDEVRRQTYETLKPGGIELNYEIERAAYRDAAATYSHTAKEAGGFSIEAIEPLEDFQKLVPANFSKRISIYPYIPNTRLAAIPSENLRAELSGRIVEAEFKALFENGVFDPDGQPGNWLIDLLEKKLARIDYAQLRRLEKSEREALQRVLTALIMPAENAEKARALARDFGAIFDADGSLLSGLSDVILKIMNEKEYPDSMQPHEMIFFIRERIEAIYEERGMARPVQIRDSIRSALALIAKTQIYREHMDDMSYFQILLKYLMPEFP